MKKFFALLMALCLVMSLGVTAMAADETPSITINFKEAGHTYEAYQVFAGNISDGKLVDIEWGTGVKGSDLLTELTALDAYKDCESAADVAAVLETFDDDSEALDAFAAIAGKHLNTVAGTSTEGTADANGVVPYTIALSAPGYYIVKDKDGTTPSDGSATKYILEVLNDVSLNAKASTPEIIKEIVEGSTPTKFSNGAIGDNVPFQISSKVPNMDGYNKYYFVLNDTMDEGLTFNDDVAITIGTTELTEDDFTVTYSTDSSTGKTSIQIVLVDFLAKYKTQAGAAIAVNYSATINEDVKIGPDGVVNSAKLIYSNDPNYDYGGDDIPEDDEPVGETPDSTTITYVTEVELKKVDGKTKASLSGAKFKIAGEALNTTIITGSKFEKNPYTLADGETAADDVDYYLLKNGSFTKTAPTELTASNYPEYDAAGTPTYQKVDFVNTVKKGDGVTYEGWVDENGEMSFTGLGEGEYTITELVAPDGYNLLKEPLTLVIDWAAPEEGETQCTWTYTVDGTELKDTICIEVENLSGTELPSTGGMGTTIFYIAGSILVLGAAVLLLSKKRMHA